MSAKFAWTGIALLLILVLSVGCKDQALRSGWAGHDVRVDGKLNDWVDLPATFFEEEQAALGIANDSSRLYLSFRTRNPGLARSIVMGGLTIYPDRTGKRLRDFVLRYRGGPSPRDLRDRQTSEKTRRQMRSRLPIGMGPDSTVELFSCYQKNVVIERSIPTDGSYGPAVAYDTSSGFFVYEFSIPLDSSQLRLYGLGTVAGKEISIGLEWVARKRKGRRPLGGDSDFGGGPGGRGGGITGRGPGGPPNLNQGDRREIWLTVKLASGPGLGSPHDSSL
ncbi:MAG: hypothetical protein ACE5FH_08530 [Candidatus Zixiibacteriota bacterium]